MKARRLRRLVVSACLVPAFACAHDAPPAHACTAPLRPSDRNDAERWNRFVDEVDAYRACMSAFITDNHAASDRHRAAANAATEAWNAFVRSSLNVPEDYPWPPPERSGATGHDE